MLGSAMHSITDWFKQPPKPSDLPQGKSELLTFSLALVDAKEVLVKRHLLHPHRMTLINKWKGML